MKHVLVFDVESIGLHGEGYAVGATLLNTETLTREYSFWLACPPEAAKGAKSDRKWIYENVPHIPFTHETPKEVREAFWDQWQRRKADFPDLVMAAECAWPVEANFLSSCIAGDPEARRFKGPYPLHEIASFMQAAGFDPMATYDRGPDELPKHDPLADARQSARLLSQSLEILRNKVNAP